jgi:hypothetical protein
MRMLKPHSRIMGVDDGPYVRGSANSPLVMTVCRMDGYLDGVMAAKVRTDGFDSAEVIAGALDGSRFRSQVRCIISDGGCLAGFNVLDMDALREASGVPVLTASDERPDPAVFEVALARSGLERERRLGAINAHPPFQVDLPDGTCFVRACGATEEEAASIVRRSVVRGRMPEPVRMAHIIAKALGRGFDDGL